MKIDKDSDVQTVSDKHSIAFSRMDEIDDIRILMAIKKEINNRFTNVLENKMTYSKGKLTRDDYKRSMTKGGKH